MENSFIVIPTRQIKSKSKRQQKKANKRKEDQIKKQINKQLLSKRKAFTKGERKRLVNELYSNNKANVTKLNTQINDLFDINDLQPFLDNIISQVQNHVHNYESLIGEYQSKFLVDIKHYHWSIENYRELLPMLVDYLNELQSSKYGQNYEKASITVNNGYTLLGTISKHLIDTLEEIGPKDTAKYVITNVKLLFVETAEDVFYASKQLRQQNAETRYGIGTKIDANDVRKLLGI